MEDLDAIKPMDLPLADFCISPTAELCGDFTRDTELYAPPDSQQDFQPCAHAFPNQWENNWNPGESFSESVNQRQDFGDDYQLDCTFPPFFFFSSLPGHFEQMSSSQHDGGMDNFADCETHAGFYSEVSKVKASLICDVKQSTSAGTLMNETVKSEKVKDNDADSPDTTCDLPAPRIAHESNSPQTATASPTEKKRKSVSAGKRLRCCTKRTRYTFSPAQLNIFENMFKLDHYPKRLHLVEMEKRYNIPEDKLRTWFQNRRAKEKRAKLANADIENCNSTSGEKKEIEGKPTQYVSPHNIKPSTSASGQSPSDWSGQASGFRSTLPNPYFHGSGDTCHSKPYLNTGLLSGTNSNSVARLGHPSTAVPYPQDLTSKTMESAPPESLASNTYPRPIPSPFSSGSSPNVLSSSSGVGYPSAPPHMPSCVPRLCYPPLPYRHHLSLPGWGREAQPLTPPASPRPWPIGQFAQNYSYTDLQPYVPRNNSWPSHLKDAGTSHRDPETTSSVKTELVQPSPNIAQSSQTAYRTEFATPTRPHFLPGYHANHTSVWQWPDSSQYKTNTVFPYGYPNYLGVGHPIKLLPNLYPWNSCYPEAMTPPYSSAGLAVPQVTGAAASQTQEDVRTLNSSDVTKAHESQAHEG